MFKVIDNNRAQASMGEYGLIFIIVIGMVSLMTIYFKRSVQARVYDARNAMVGIVADRAGDSNYVGNLYSAYEPYYINTTSSVQRFSDTTTELGEGGTTGVYTKTINEATITSTQSQTAPPKDAL